MQAWQRRQAKSLPASLTWIAPCAALSIRSDWLYFVLLQLRCRASRACAPAVSSNAETWKTLANDVSSKASICMLNKHRPSGHAHQTQSQCIASQLRYATERAGRQASGQVEHGASSTKILVWLLDPIRRSRGCAQCRRDACSQGQVGLRQLHTAASATGSWKHSDGSI